MRKVYNIQKDNLHLEEHILNSDRGFNLEENVGGNELKDEPH